MILTKEKGLRMWGGGAGSSGGGGGMDAGALAAYATQQFVEETYVGKLFFSNLFTIHGKQTVTVVDGTTSEETVTVTDIVLAPNEVPSTVEETDPDTGDITTTVREIISIEANYGLWTEQFLSALGLGDGGGGGGASSLGELSDVQLTTPTNGQALVYNATSGKWENQTIGGGGGTLTSIGLVMPTGFSVSPATLTANGSFTVGFDSGYRLLTDEDVSVIQNGYNAYQWTQKQANVIDATNSSGTAAVTSSPYTAAIWRVDLTGKIDTLTTGTTILLKVPVAGNGSYGTLLRIDGTSSSTDSNTNLYPVCANVNSMIGTRYGVGCIVALTFDADQTGQTFYYQSSSKKTSVEGGTGWTKPGCWKIADYDANTIAYQLRTNSYTRTMSDKVYRYRLLFTSADNTKWVPANTSTSTNATASRSACQTKIDPFGEIVYYGSTTSVAAGSSPGATVLWQQYTLSLGYSFNTTGSALVLTYPAPVYLKCAPQSDGSAIIDSTTPYVQALPSTADGKIYILLGYAYSETVIELIMHHPVYYYADGAIRLWTNGSGVADKLSTTNKTAWGQTYWTANGVPANISGNMTDVGNITTGSGGGLLSGFQGIELNTNGTLTTSGGYIDFHYNGSSSDFTSRIIEDISGRLQINAQVYIPAAKSLRIGDGLLSWDSTNNALKVSLYDGSAADFYSLGAVSALGFQSGGSSTNAATIGTLNVTTQLNMEDGTRISTPQDLYIGNEDSEGWVFVADMCSQAGPSYWSVNEAGEAKFAAFVRSPKFYFDASKYLYVSGYNLMFFDGQDTYKVTLQQV